MNEEQPRVRVAPGVPFGLRFIGLGAGFFAVALLVVALTGGEVWDKAAHRAMTLREMLRVAILLAMGGGGLWWTGGKLRRWED